MNEQPRVIESDLLSQLPASIVAWKALDVMSDTNWFRPWETLRPLFNVRGYELYRPHKTLGIPPQPFGATSPSLVPFDNFELFGDRSAGFRASFVQWSTVAFGARDESNRDVVIKVVSKGVSEGEGELSILKFLNSEPLKSNPLNASVPILEFMQLGDWTFIVMPFCSSCDELPIRNAWECLEFTEQTLRALLFLHQNGIAHLDISHENILMNHHGRIPETVLWINEVPVPVDPTPEFRSTFPVRYLLIDFELSLRCPPDVPSSQWFVDPSSIGRMHKAPETSRVRYNPFAADIYQLGRLIYGWFRDVIPRIPGFLELLKDMTHVRPQERPSASRTVERLVLLRRQVSGDILFEIMDMIPGMGWEDPWQPGQSA